MRLDFIDQRMINFKAFVGAHTFRWDQPGLTNIRGKNQVDKELGENGVSKSSIFDAWCWCLFGRTPAGLRNLDVVPWQRAAGSNTKVPIRLCIDGREHVVQRTTNPNSLTWDDAAIDQDKLNAKLGLNFQLACNTILLAQGRPLFFDLTPEKKMELFAEILDLEKWDARSDLASDKQLAAEAEAQQLQTELAGFKAVAAEIETQLGALRDTAEVWAAKARKAKRDTAAQIKTLEQALSKQEKIYDTANLVEDGAATELVSLRREAEKLTAESRVAVNALNRAELVIEDAEQQVRSHAAALAELKHTKTCPTCGQSVKRQNLATHRAELEQALEAAKQVVQNGVPKKVRATVALLQQRMESTASYVTSFEAKQNAAQATIDRLQPEVQRMRAEIALLRAASGEEAGINPYTAQIQVLQGRRRELKGDTAAVQKALSVASAAAERYRFWRRGFKDIKLQLVEEVLGELEIVTNSLLEEVGLVEWQVRYDIEKENKSGTVKRALHAMISSPESKGYVRWEAWSGGENQRLKVAGALALADVLLAKAGVNCNIEILDEPATYWSADGVQNLCAFLSDRARQYDRSIVFVEHQAAESAHFSRILTVIKDGKGAYIVED